MNHNKKYSVKNITEILKSVVIFILTLFWNPKPQKSGPGWLANVQFAVKSGHHKFKILKIIPRQMRNWFIFSNFNSKVSPPTDHIPSIDTTIGSSKSTTSQIRSLAIWKNCLACRPFSYTSVWTPPYFKIWCHMSHAMRCSLHAPYHDDPYHDGPYHDGPYHDAPYHDGPYHDGPYHDAPYHDAPYHDGPYHDAPYHDGPYHDGPYHDAPYHDAPYHDGPYHDAPYHDGPYHDGPYHDGPYHDGPYHDGPCHLLSLEVFLYRAADQIIFLTSYVN